MFLARPSAGGACACFLVHTADSQDVWCKASNNPQGTKVLVNEFVVARLGREIGVEIPQPHLVRLDGIEGSPFCSKFPELRLEVGWAHGLEAVHDASEIRALAHLTDDENRRRYAGFFALFDWLHGFDKQWLYSLDLRNGYVSFDHSHYFPGGPNWSKESLEAAGTDRATLGESTHGLDPDEIRRLANEIEAVSEEFVDEMLSGVPAEWDVSDEDLRALARFVLLRRESSAERLKSLVP